jgi:hypothetical protein
MPVVRQAGKIKFTLMSARLSGDLLTRLLDGEGNFRITRRSQIKQMLLTFALDDAFAATAMNPAIVPGEFFQRRSVRLPKLLERSRRCIQDAVEFCDTLL